MNTIHRQQHLGLTIHRASNRRRRRLRLPSKWVYVAAVIGVIAGIYFG